MKTLVAGGAVFFITLFVFTGYKNIELSNKIFSDASIKGIPPKEYFPMPDSLSFIYGRWKASRYVLNDVATASDEDNLKRFLGKTITLTEIRAVMFVDTCLRPLYDFRRFHTLEFFYKFYGQQSNIGIHHDSITIVRIRCAGRTDYDNDVITKFFYRIIILNNQSIAIPVPEGFLFFDKVKAAEIAVKKLPAEKKKDEGKPTEKISGANNIFIYQDDPADPFRVISALINSAVNGTKANVRDNTKLK